MADEHSADVPRRGHGAPRVDALRASVVVILFVVALALLMGPASNLVGSSSVTSTTQHHTTPPTVKTGNHTVQVANGTSTQGLANNWAQGLKTAYGWATLPAISTSGGFHHPHTWIYFQVGQQQAAQLLASQLHVNHAYVTLLTHQARSAVAGAGADDIVVVIGLSHHGEGPGQPAG